MKEAKVSNPPGNTVKLEHLDSGRISKEVKFPMSQPLFATSYNRPKSRFPKLVKFPIPSSIGFKLQHFERGDVSQKNQLSKLA